MKVKVRNTYGKANLAEWFEALIEDKLKTWHMIAAVVVFNVVTTIALITTIK